MPTEVLAQLRLLQLVSPTLPVGAYSYSQGIEWAVEAGWIDDEAALMDWLSGLMTTNLQQLELPVLHRLHQACSNGNRGEFRHWAEWLMASRETRELRAEEGTRAGAMAALLTKLNVKMAGEWREELVLCQLGAFAVAAVSWNIDSQGAALGYSHSWLENQVAAAVKLVPLGQTAGQRVLLELASYLPEILARARLVEDDNIGASAAALAIASCQHEIQYTRLFRS